MADYYFVITGFFLILIQPLYSSAVAPDDRHDICRTDFRYRSQHDWIPYANDSSSGTWRVLLDQYDYQNLLGEFVIPKGVWTAKDVDGTGRQFGQGSGGVCTYQLSVNSYTDSVSNNWVFTQAVNYSDAVEVIVNATVRFYACTQRPDCSNDFVTLHRYDTNSTSEVQRINQNNYDPYLGDSTRSRLQQGSTSDSTTITERFLRPQNTNFAYFGIQDTGTTGTVIRILVYYKVCPRRVEGLVIYPEIPHPPQGSSSPIRRTAQCVVNAHNTTSLETFAHADGQCVQSATCVCELGYEEQSDQSGTQCTACAAGQYRSAENSSCLACPTNSTSMTASRSCSCIEEHYRARNEGVGVECTAPPPSISECTPNTVYDTGAVLQWRSPSHCGGRTDCYYLISINNGVPVRYNPINFNFNALETYTVNNIEPDTIYSITVSVHNGVSDQDAGDAKLRECQIVVTTIPGSVFMLRGVTYLNNTAAIIEQIGEGEANSLKCTTALETCCQTSRQGEFYYPSGSIVNIESSGEDFYRTRSAGLISLNRKRGNSPLGRYRCVIPDGRGVLQNVYITIGSEIECATVCPPCECSTTSPPTVSCPTCPSCPTTSPPPTCGTLTTCSTPLPGIGFRFGGQSYPNNSVFLMTDIGAGDLALMCVTDHDQCCQTLSFRAGEWFFPDNTQVLISAAGMSFYRDRGSQTVRLNRRDNVLSPTGRYRCTIPDASGAMQTLVANIIVESESTCPPIPPPVICPTLPECTAPEPSTCPDTPECTIPNPTFSCEDCPTPTTQSCPPITTCPTSEAVDGVGFKFSGQSYPNNSIFLMTEIGENDMALMCVTDHDQCCQTSREGEWFFPDNTLVPNLSAGMSFYRERGSQTVRLNRRDNALSPTGRYRCTIPDASGAMQTLVANIIVESGSTCPPIPPPVICPTLPECTTPEPSTCPDIPECMLTQAMQTLVARIINEMRECPTATTSTPSASTYPPMTTEDPKPKLAFSLRGQIYLNNSNVSLKDIGERDNALLCYSDNPFCCVRSSSFRGEFYYPNGSNIRVYNRQDGFYRNRDSSYVRLNRHQNAVNLPAGRYRCAIMDFVSTVQWLFISLV